LQFAHHDGIIHRDIKPENILLDKNGRVKIADFGLAKLLGADRLDHNLTATHQAMGTLHYVAPEQLVSAAKVDHRADIYSLGVVFYEMLTGQVPRGRFAHPSEKVAIDSRLDAVVLRALESEPERRYQTISEMQADVETLSLGHAQPTAAQMPSALGSASFQSALRKIPLPRNIQAIKHHLQAPALWLLVTGIFALVQSSVTILGWAYLFFTSEWFELRHLDSLSPLAILAFFQLPAGFFIILGSRKIQRLEFIAMARLGCILALVPLGPAAVLTIPVGIWTLILLLQPGVRDAFHGAFDSGPEPERTVVGLNGPSWGLFVAALAILPFAIGGLVFFFVELKHQPNRDEGFWQFVLALTALIAFTSAILMILASREMHICRDYALARLG
jgi:hypothetical protein